MNRLMILLCVVGAGLSILAGWISAPLDASKEVTPVRASPRVPTLERPGVTILASANGLLAEHPPPPPPTWQSYLRGRFQPLSRTAAESSASSCGSLRQSRIYRFFTSAISSWTGGD